MFKRILLAIVAVALFAPGSAGAQGYQLSAYSYSAGPDSLYVIWGTYEPPGPDQYPA